MKIQESNLRSVIRNIIIVEAATQSKRLRAFTNKITREVMSLFKFQYGESSQPVDEEDIIHDRNLSTDEIYEINAGNFPLAFDPETLDEDYEDISELDTYVTVVLEIDRNSDKFNVSASDKSMTGMSDFGIHLAIETPPNFPDQRLAELRNEVANSIRHELEHVTQGVVTGQSAGSYGRGENYWSFSHSPSDAETPYARYLLDPAEIPAHVKGYMQNSRSFLDLKGSIENLMDNYLEKEMITSQDAEVVTSTWLDWAKRNINKKGFR